MSLQDLAAWSGWVVVALSLLDRFIALSKANAAIVSIREWQSRHEISDATRHRENKETLSEIRDDVKRINGKVHEHEAILKRRT